MKVIELSEIREGQFVEELNQNIRKAAKIARETHQKIKVTVTLTLEPRMIGPADAQVPGVNLTDHIDVSKPKPQAGVTTFYEHVNDEGEVEQLNRRHPKNKELPLGKVHTLRD